MQRQERIRIDYAVVGAGVAGLRAAVELARGARVLLLAKGDVGESATAVAQGGVAVALSDEDEISLHEQDTIRAGDGLCNPDAVRVLVEEGPHYIQELIGWGTQFDRSGTKLVFTREGAHSRSRVLHAHGDSTGWEIGRALLAKVHTLDRIEVRSHSFTMAIEPRGEGDGQGISLRVLDEQSGQVFRADCRAALLASGGLGQMYPETTNPASATGDGMAIGFRAGAALSDMEFIQFHPTALSAKNAPPFLLSEALRGEGAILRNALLERFMPRYNEAAELAPRDIVSRAIVSEIKRTRTSYVYLDLTSMDGEYVKKRFPRIYATCLHYGIDITTDMVPVRPAAHYSMGGLKTDLYGRTTLAGLYAAGEVASTGVHGANRLASNSLLEGLVFGARAGKAMLEDMRGLSTPEAGNAQSGPHDEPKSGEKHGKQPAEQHRQTHGQAHDHAHATALAAAAAVSTSAPQGEVSEPVLDRIRQILGEQVEILREGRGLEQAIEQLDRAEVPCPENSSRREWEIFNMWTLARVVARSALARHESRGSHYRSDFPYRDDEQFARHSVITREGPVRFE
ncbi:MAG TPA: L-aspartate oxidase [Candidatus Dormibacteraeota bacterium]|nr:L-aspartate oxidase [Candidatus Dormibacteraeota bacterium]